MHFRNGRLAQPGDRVVSLTSGVAGVLYAVKAAQSCNGRLALTSFNDPLITIGDCVHADDLPTSIVPIPFAPEKPVTPLPS